MKKDFAIIPIAAIMFLLPWIFKGEDCNNNSIDETLSVHFIDVGQGDCELVELPGKKYMLIDAGDNGEENAVLSYLDKEGVRKIDYLVATHPHADHVGGMEEVIKKYDVGEIYMPRKESTSITFEKMLDAIDEKNLSIHTAEAGKNIFDYSDVRADFLGPQKDYDDLNNASAVVKLQCKDVSFLFMGDAESEAELDILASGADVSCNVLKVGHHGSSTSSSEQFLKKASPEYAVISCGKDNKYGHPHKETLDKLKQIHAKVLRCDEMGTIIIKTDGHNLQVEKQSR